MPAVGAAFKDGYIFNGYYYEESDGSRIFYYDKDVQCLRNWDKPTDAVLSADFIIQNYQINYMGLDGGSNHPDNPTAYNIESPTIQLNDPSRPGYIGSWDISSIPHGSTGNITVTAIWSLEYYTITYVLEDGWTNPDSNPSAYTILDSFVFEKPQKPGYTGEWDIKFIALGSTGDLTVNSISGCARMAESPLWKCRTARSSSRRITARSTEVLAIAESTAFRLLRATAAKAAKEASVAIR